MSQPDYQRPVCLVYTGTANLNCRSEDLYLLEDLAEIGRPGELLKACAKCGQVYREVIREMPSGHSYSSFYRIEGRRANQCRCIGYLEAVKVLLDEKTCEGDQMYFSWEKETRMRCRKCGEHYIERIAQSNYEGFYSQKYVKE